jgi:hypothetical protein
MTQDKATRHTHQSFFFESDIFSADRLIARRARPGTTIQEPARSIPVLRDCDVLVVGGGPSGTAAAVPRRAPAPTSYCWSATTTWAASPPAAW